VMVKYSSPPSTKPSEFGQENAAETLFKLPTPVKIRRPEQTPNLHHADDYWH
jgi:hypothetical protein